MIRLPALTRPALATLCACAVLAVPSLADDGTVVAAMRTADGKEVGTIAFREAQHGLIVTARVSGLPAGAHGLHIHTVGACAPDFNAAGGHFNPAGTEHGFLAASGYHAGDMPNLDVAADGTGEAEFFVPGLTLTSPVDERRPYTLGDGDGAAIMIHAATDDYQTMASSGGRLACGVILPKG
jgi:Cu-Zn family superoxide dismutase